MKSYNRVVLYNSHHNGDIHYSREFARYFIKNIPANEYYFIHQNSPRLVMDIPEIKSHGPEAPVEVTQKWTSLSQETHFQEIDGTLYINLWVGRNHRIYLQNYNDCTINANYAACQDACEQLGLSRDIGPLESFIPEYDYSPFNTEHIDNFINSKQNKLKVLISNGECLSGQADNFDMSPAINKLCLEYPDVIFLATNESHTLEHGYPNLYYTSDIINIQFGDLVENSYLSTHCDIIVGRASGAFCFACTKANWISDKPVICFSHRKEEGMWAENSTGIWTNFQNSDNLFNVIAEQLNKRSV